MLSIAARVLDKRRRELEVLERDMPKLEKHAHFGRLRGILAGLVDELR